MIDDCAAASCQPLRLYCDIGINEFDGWIAASRLQGSLDMAHDYCREAHPIALDHPRLRRDIAYLVRSNGAGILDLNKPPAAPAVWLKDIGADHHAIALECGFEDRQLNLRGQQLSGARDCGGNLVVIFRNEVPARIASAGKFTDVMPAMEQGQSGFVKLRKFASMNLEPQAARTVLERCNLAFGKARLIKSRWWGGWPHAEGCLTNV